MPDEVQTIPAGQQLAPAAPRSTMDMIDMAVSKGASIEVLERLMSLHERWEISQARRSFDAAMAAAKAEIPPIKKNQSVGFKSKDATKSSTSYTHEDLGEIARTIDPILAKYGLSYRFRTAQAPAITVTCIIAHKGGHCEETTLSAGADTSGNKNSIQAIGSTVTYLQRYTLKAALGLSATQDDDGKVADGVPVNITAEQVAELLKIADETGADKVKFCRHHNIASFSDILASQFHDAKTSLERKRKVSANV